MLDLVLAPGLLCDAGVWVDQQRGLAPDARVTVADYGDCDSLAGMAGRLLAAAPARFALAGHSMGGRVAMEVFRAAPERVAAIALIDTGVQALAAGESGQRERESRLALLDLARREGMAVMARRWVQNMVHPTRLADAGLIDTIVAMFARRTPAIFAAQVRALLARRETESLLPSLHIPTLVLVGDADVAAPPAQHAAMAARVPGSRLVVVPECGHMSTLERPDAVTAALRDWLARVPPA